MKAINNFDDLNKSFSESFAEFPNAQIVKERLPEEFFLFPVESDVLCQFCQNTEVLARIEMRIKCDAYDGHSWICNVVTCKSCLSLLKK